MGLCWCVRRLVLRTVKVANLVSKSRWVWLAGLALAGLLAVTGCGGGGGTGTSQVETEVEPASTFFPIKLGASTARLQLALTMPEMQRGLMGRTDLGENDGMIFIYPEPQQMSFWMRNTPTALDIGFFDAGGVLREVYPLHPYDETPLKSRSIVLKYAVEMPQGWYRAQGVKSGDRLDLAALAAAVRARGGEPADLGIAAP